MVRHKPYGDVDVLEIEGAWTASAEGVVFDVVRPLLLEGRQRFVLDLAGVNFTDTAGIGLFVTMLVLVKVRYGGKIAIAKPWVGLTNAFEITRIDQEIAVFPTVSEAVEALQKPPPD